MSESAITWSEHESKQLLSRHGLPVNREELVHDSDAAREVGDRLGYPVVAKLCGAAIAHKTERNLVRLGLGNGDALAAAVDELLALAQPDDGDVGVLVGEMVRANRELIVGVDETADFGRVVMVGIGGIFAEALGDVAFRLLPVDEIDVLEMLDDLHHQSLLGPFRGEPEVDRDAMAAAIVAVGEAAAATPSLASIDVNPMMIRDGRPVAVDALVVTR